MASLITWGSLVLCTLLSLADAGDVEITRDLYVQGAVTATEVVAQTLRSTGQATVTGRLSATEVNAQSLSAAEMVVDAIRPTSPTGTIVIEGNLLIRSRVGPSPSPNPAVGSTPEPASNATNTTSSANTSDPGTAGNTTLPSLASLYSDASPSASGPRGGEPLRAQAVALLAEEVVLAGTRQWRLVRLDDFQSGAQGWSLNATSSCDTAPHDRFLGGPCVFADGVLNKTFTGLPAHTQVRVTAQLHFIDRWAGEPVLVHTLPADSDSNADSDLNADAESSSDSDASDSDSDFEPESVSNSDSPSEAGAGAGAGTGSAGVEDGGQVLTVLTAPRTPVDGPVRGLDVCGSAKFPELRFGQSLDLTFNHRAAQLNLAVRILPALPADAAGLAALLGSGFVPGFNQAADPCERSLGLDNVMVYVR